MRKRTLPIALALAASLVALLVLVTVAPGPGGGTAHASSTPGSQAVVCKAAMDKLTSTEDTVNGEYRLGRLHPLFFLGIGGRPDEWILEYERRSVLFQQAFDYATTTCPEFAPFTGPLQGHL
jgi:hypothetical protein